MRIMVVTGSRTLGDMKNPKRAEALESFRRFMFEWWNSFPEESLVVVSGEAEGPDTWASTWVSLRNEAAATVGKKSNVSHMQIRCDGRIFTSPDGDISIWSPSPVHPLERNKRIVQEASRMSCDGHDVRCLALHDKDSSTNGTMHTVRLMKEVGLEGTIKVF
jgi:hypothetical protein